MELPYLSHDKQKVAFWLKNDVFLSVIFLYLVGWGAFSQNYEAPQTEGRDNLFVLT